MKNNNKIEENERIEILKLAIWFNLFIGFYNLYVFNEMNSLFHLVLGCANVGVWVFFREKYLNLTIPMKERSRSINLANSVSIVMFEAIRQANVK